MKLFYILAVASFFSRPLSYGAEAPDNKPKVLYFGGYLATKAQASCWAKGAKMANSRYDYQGFPWPEGLRGSGAASAESEAATLLITPALKQLLSPANSKRKFVIAGHSSGAAMANRVAREALSRNPRLASRLTLVALDGFIPSASLRSRVPVICVGARSEHGVSRNFSGMQKCNEDTRSAGGNPSRTWVYRDQRAKACQTPWCLHFTVINKATPPTLGQKTWSRRGYEGCTGNANVDWLAL
jgi:hypothetical protein